MKSKKGTYKVTLASGIMLSTGRMSLTSDSPLRIFEFFGMTLVFGTAGMFVLHTALGFGAVAGKLHLDGRLLDEVNYRSFALGYPLYTIFTTHL